MDYFHFSWPIFPQWNNENVLNMMQVFLKVLRRSQIFRATTLLGLSWGYGAFPQRKAKHRILCDLMIFLYWGGTLVHHGRVAWGLTKFQKGVSLGDKFYQSRDLSNFSGKGKEYIVTCERDVNIYKMSPLQGMVGRAAFFFSLGGTEVEKFTELESDIGSQM